MLVFGWSVCVASSERTQLEGLAAAIALSEDLDHMIGKVVDRFGDAAAADLARFAHAADDFDGRAPGIRPVVLDLEGPDRPLVQAVMGGAPPATVVAVPLRHGPRLEGVVMLGWRNPRTLTATELDMLTTMAAPCGPAIARFRALEERDTGMAASERALALRDEVLGVVAHDLRNPLNVILTTAEHMQRRATDPAQQRHLERILRSVQRAERLVRDLLEVNVIESAGLTIDARPVVVAQMVLAAIDSQQILAASASVALTTDLSPSLPAVLADEPRVHEVLVNLISNAIKHSEPGGVVTVGATQDHGELRMWVRDHGRGIPAEEMPHVFDRFWQGVKRDRRGAGLGLAICRAIVDAHGGRIWGESAVGHGTTMSFTLPVSHGDAIVQDAPPVKILLVDDRPENLLALSAILNDPRYQLVTATSGEDALKEALRADFSLALIDIAMPRMDGIEFASHLKKLSRYRDIPIIFVTAFGDDPQEVHRAYAAGAADYLVKPLDAEVVRKKVAVFVELSLRVQGQAAGGVTSPDALSAGKV
jgi:signal transduction histidine kinase